VALAPMLWASLGRAAGWEEPHTLCCLCVAVGIAMPALVLCAAWASPVAPIGAATLIVDSERARPCRVLLAHLLAAAVGSTGGAVAFCFGPKHWRCIVVSMLAAAAASDRAVTLLLVGPGSSCGWASATLASVVAALLSSRLRPARHYNAPSHVWTGGYAGLRKPRGPCEREDTIVGELQHLTARLSSALRAQSGLSSEAAWADPPTKELFNWVLHELWPCVRSFLELDLLKGEVEAILHKDVSGNLHFDRVSLGDEPVHVHSLWVLGPSLGVDALTVALDCEYAGRDADVAVKFGLGPMEFTVGVTKLAIRGVLYMAFRHRLPHLPLLHGMNLFWANPPEIDIELGSPSGATSLLPDKLLDQLKDAIGRVLMHVMVLPNRVAVPFQRMAPLEKLKHAPPEGILALHVLGAKRTPPGADVDERKGVSDVGDSVAAQGSDALNPSEDFEEGRSHASSRLYCRLQLGAQCWSSRAAGAVGGSALWDERARLFVDHRLGQELRVSLHEKHTFGDVQITERRGLGVLDVVRQTALESMPTWALPGNHGVPQVLLSAAWHNLSSCVGAFTPALGAVLLVTFECVRNVPPHLDKKTLVVRAFSVASGEQRPRDTDAPLAQSDQVRASRVTPEEHAHLFMCRLMQRSAAQPPHPSHGGGSLRRTSAERKTKDDREGSASFLETGRGASGSGGAPAAGGLDGGGGANAAFTAASRDRCKERLRYLWHHFRTSDGAHLSDWVQRDREGCVQTLAELLGVVPGEEVCVGQLLDELCHDHRNGPLGVLRHRFGAPRRSGRQAATGPKLERGVECHWDEQLRIFVDDPGAQDLWLEVAHVRRRAEPMVLGVWRQPLRALMRTAPNMTAHMQGRRLLSPDEFSGARVAAAASVTRGGRATASEPAGDKAPPTLFVQLQLLHILPPISWP